MSAETDEIIADVIDVINEYGSSITIRTVTPPGTYNPRDPEAGETNDDEVTKGIIRQFATNSLQESLKSTSVSNDISSTYDLSITLYTTAGITKKNKILFAGDVYEITFISEKILQDTKLIYEVLVKK